MIERRSFELRAEGEGSVISGIVIPYSTQSLVGSFREQFAPGSIKFSDVIANIQHQRSAPLARTGGGGLELSDGPDALRATIELPDTSIGRDTLTLIRRGVLRGLSAEFIAVREEWVGRLRTIREAKLSGLGIVDSPAYAGASVSEVRANSKYSETPTKRVFF